MTTMTKQPLELWKADPSDLDDLIDRAALDLYRNMQDGYNEGFESDLANYLLGAHTAEVDVPSICDAVIDDGLSFLVHNKMRELIAVDCLLDEAVDASYVTTDVMAKMLLAEIHAQGDKYGALHRLVVDEIVTRSRFESVKHRSWLAAPGSPCSGCGTPRKREADDELGNVEICLNSDCINDK